MPILILLAALLTGFDEHLRLGQYHLDRKEPGRAVTEYESAVNEKPASSAAQYNLGVALRLWGDNAGAEKALREAIRLRPRFPEAHFVLGLVFGDRVGSESLGLGEFETAVAQDPRFADAHFNLGIIHWKLNEVDAAIVAFSKAVQISPESAVFRGWLGQALGHAGKLAEAREQLEFSMKLDPTQEKVNYQLALTYQKLGEDAKAADALAALKRVREQRGTLDRDQAGLAYREGRTALERGDADAAIGRLTQALKAPFDEALIRATLGIALERKGNTQEAAAEFRKALDINPRQADAHLNLGVLLLRAGDAAGAESEFRAALDTDPNFAEAHFNLGLASATGQRWKEAAEALRTAIALRPANAHAHWNLARVLRDSGDQDAALASYAAALTLNPGLADAAVEYSRLLPPQQARKVLLHAVKRDPLNRQLQERFLSTLEPAEAAPARARFAQLNSREAQAGIEQLNRGAFPQAIETLRKFLAAHPDLEEIRRNLALALFASRQYGEAAAEYERLVKADPDDFTLRLDLGIALREASQLERARKELEEVARAWPDSAAAHFQLGLLWLAQKDIPQAMEHFHRARRLDPDLKPPRDL